jgi:hypothetical protein
MISLPPNVLKIANPGESATFDWMRFSSLSALNDVVLPLEAKKKLAAFGRHCFISRR